MFDIRQTLAEKILDYLNNKDDMIGFPYQFISSYASSFKTTAQELQDTVQRLIDDKKVIYGTFERSDEWVKEIYPTGRLSEWCKTIVVRPLEPKGRSRPGERALEKATEDFSEATAVAVRVWEKLSERSKGPLAPTERGRA